MVTLTGIQKMINSRSAVAKPPRKTFVGVAGNGLILGQRVEAMITTFPRRRRRKKEKKIDITLLPINYRFRYYFCELPSHHYLRREIYLRLV